MAEKNQYNYNPPLAEDLRRRTDLNREYGRVGQKRYAGIFWEEFVPELRGRKGCEVYREMSENDDIIGAILFAIENLIRQATFDVRPAGNKPMNLSTKQIGRVVSYCYGKNTQQYLTGVKVEKAKELLKNPEYSVGYIAGVLGFCNEYYFNRFFKQAEGMPPGKYRKSIIS